MIKFIRSRTSHANAERQKLQKQLFEFNKTLHHGFPHRPTALAYDSQLSLLAIGTKSGAVRVYGQPGVEFETNLEDEVKISLLQFIEGAGQLLAVCEDNSLHLFQINSSEEEAVSTISLLSSDFSQVNVDDSEEARTAERHQITNLIYVATAGRVLLGDACGQIIALKVDSFDVEPEAGLRTDQVIQALPEDQRRAGSLGAVEALAARPHHPNEILIGYNRGVIVLWDITSNEIKNVFITAQRLECVSWLPCGQRLISAHNDGSYVGWKLTDDPLNPSEPANTAYGPFPCKPINKLYAHCNPGDNVAEDQLLVFSGGLPRQSYSLRYTVSVAHGPLDGSKHKTFDFTSKVIDFVVIEKPMEGDENKTIPEALIVLADEELVAIDLQHPQWAQIRLPYLISVHLSPITCCHALASVGPELIEQFKEIGDKQNESKFSTGFWPIRGGHLKSNAVRKEHELLITGHEDGSVRLWDVSGSAMVLLCSLNTSKLFSSLDDDITMVDDEDEEWPPFRRVGVFDPYTDDPRLGVRKVLLCPRTGSLVVAGTAGQLIVYQLSQQHNPITLNPITINLVGDCDGFVWKSHDKLVVRSGSIEMPSGFQPKAMVQIWPPAAVSALSLHSEWGLVAVGTGHGFAVFDYVHEKQLCSRCTLNPADVLGVGSGDALITRRKSFKKSLRESFRRLRRSKSQRQTKKGTLATTSAPSLTSPTSPVAAGGFKRGGLPTAAPEEDWHSDSKPVERQIEAKGEDGLGSVVRCLHFSSAPVSGSSNKPVPSLWAGTNAGRIFVYTLELPVEKPTKSTSTPVDLQGEFDEPGPKEQLEEKANSTSTEEPAPSTSEAPKTPVTSVLAKEIQLKHHAPVIYIQTLDPTGRPNIDLQEATDKNHTPKVLICSDEQFKLFQLPSLKALGKFKLTAHEGSKARRVHIAEFVSLSEPVQRDFAIVCACNQGLVGIYSVLDLKRQLQSNYTKKEDINGICSLVFANNGDGFFLSSPSEFARFSLAAGKVLRPNCYLTVDASLRVTLASEQKSNDQDHAVDPNASLSTENQKEESKPNEESKEEPQNKEDEKKDASNSNEAEKTDGGENNETNTTEEEKVTEQETSTVAIVDPSEPQTDNQPEQTQSAESTESKLSEKTDSVVTEESEQVESEPQLNETTEQLHSLSLDADETANDSQLFEDSKADEDTIIDHIEQNGRHSISPTPLENDQEVHSNGKCDEEKEETKTNGVYENGEQEKKSESEEKMTIEESKGKTHKTLELSDDVHNRLHENGLSELKSL